MYVRSEGVSCSTPRTEKRLEVTIRIEAWMRLPSMKLADWSFLSVTLFSLFFSPTGIPYASPPVGKLRFMPPVTPAHWTGVRPAHYPGSVCPQKLPNISNETAALQSMTQGRVNVLKRLLPSLSNQSEDCLYLNIFAPASGEFIIGDNLFFFYKNNSIVIRCILRDRNASFLQFVLLCLADISL